MVLILMLSCAVFGALLLVCIDYCRVWLLVRRGRQGLDAEVDSYLREQLPPEEPREEEV